MGRFVKVGDRLIVNDNGHHYQAKVLMLTLQKKAMLVETDGLNVWLPMTAFVDWDERPIEIKSEPSKSGEWVLHVPRPGGKDEWIESPYSGRVKATGHIASEQPFGCLHHPDADLLTVRVAEVRPQP